MSEAINDRVRSELERIRLASGGVLKPEAVVEFARDPSTALHSRFEWDDTAAAAQHRLWQARQVIRVAVEVLPHTTTETRVYVSLPSDRSRPGGGYRPLLDVMSDAEKRNELVRQALGEFRRVRDRYQQMKELEPIFIAIEQVQGEHAPQATELVVT